MPGCFFIACYDQIISLLPIPLSLPLLLSTTFHYLCYTYEYIEIDNIQVFKSLAFLTQWYGLREFLTLPFLQKKSCRVMAGRCHLSSELQLDKSQMSLLLRLCWSRAYREALFEHCLRIFFLGVETMWRVVFIPLWILSVEYTFSGIFYKLKDIHSLAEAKTGKDLHLWFKNKEGLR